MKTYNILQFMEAGYSVTKWPYFRLVDLQNAAKDCDEQIEELKRQGKVTVKKWLNCDLIKLQVDER